MLIFAHYAVQEYRIFLSTRSVLWFKSMPKCVFYRWGSSRRPGLAMGLFNSTTATFPSMLSVFGHSLYFSSVDQNVTKESTRNKEIT